MRIIADLHTHSTYSHGRGTVADNIMAALGQGLEVIAITDHGPRSAPWVGARPKEFARLRAELAVWNRKLTGIRVLAGAECNIISAVGELDVPEGVRSQLDIVLAGLHPGVRLKSPRDWALLTGVNWAARVSRHWEKQARHQNTSAVVQAVLHNEIDVITHPGYHMEIDTAELARACALRDTALEINARHHEMTPDFCRTAAREGVKFVINSDAHEPGDVGRLDPGISVALAAGLDPELVLNSEVGGLFDWLDRKQTRRRWAPPDWADWAEQPAIDRTEEQDADRNAGQNKGRPSNWRDWSEQGPVH